MEAGHGKGPCDRIGGTAKRKTEQAVKNDKEEKNSAMKVFFLLTGYYERSLFFLSEAWNGIKVVDSTVKLHAVFSLLQRNCG